MKKWILFLFITLTACQSPVVIMPKIADSVKSKSLSISINGSYYYTGEYWTDCAGVARRNIVIKSAIPLTKEWTRESTTGVYLKVSGASQDTTYYYNSDNTQSEYCGY